MCTMNSDNFQRLFSNKIINNIYKRIDNFLGGTLAMTLACQFEIGALVIVNN